MSNLTDTYCRHHHRHYSDDDDDVIVGWFWRYCSTSGGLGGNTLLRLRLHGVVTALSLPAAQLAVHLPPQVCNNRNPSYASSCLSMESCNVHFYPFQFPASRASLLLFYTCPIQRRRWRKNGNERGMGREETSSLLSPSCRGGEE